MPLFKHKKNPIWIVAAPKVMTSTLRSQPLVEQFNPSLRNFLTISRISATSWRGQTVVMLYRDPISRIKSFYRDAFHTHPANMMSRRDSLQSNYWRRSQRIFFPDLGLDNESTDQEISETLQSTSFETMLAFFKRLWWQDPHIAPQSSQVLFRYRAYSVALKPERYLNIENQELKDFFDKHHMQISMRKNQTEKKSSLLINGQDRNFLKAIYSEDYERFSVARSLNSKSR